MITEVAHLPRPLTGEVLVLEGYQEGFSSLPATPVLSFNAMQLKVGAVICKPGYSDKEGKARIRHFGRNGLGKSWVGNDILTVG